MYIRRMSTLRCYGCQIEHPSQREHMQDGCLSAWSDIVIYNFKPALKWVELPDIVMHYNMLMGYLERPAITNIKPIVDTIVLDEESGKEKHRTRAIKR